MAKTKTSAAKTGAKPAGGKPANAKSSAKPAGARAVRPAKAPMRHLEGPVALTEAGFAQCRFIVDDTATPVICCGAPTLPGRSWCAAHWKVVYVGLPNQHRRR
jgi:hypothetical protein